MMSDLAKRILKFGTRHGISDENEMALSWANDLEAVEEMKR